MKELIFFGAPFAVNLLLIIFSWCGVYENQLHENLINEPRIVLFFYFFVGVFLFFWFYYVKKENLTKGYYSKHFLTSVFIRFIVVVSSIIMFSENLLIVFEEMFEWDRVASVMFGIIAAILSAIFFIILGEIVAEWSLKAEARMKQRGINNIKAF